MAQNSDLVLEFTENKWRICGDSNEKEHTPGHIRCPACEALRTTVLQKITPDLPFSTAASTWLATLRIDGTSHAGYIKTTTYDCYEQYVDTLNLFFSQLRLDEIHTGHLREYQRARLLGAEPFIRYRRPQDAKAKKNKNGDVIAPAKGKTPCPVKPEKVNQELQVVVRLLTRVGLWNQELQESYRTLLTEEHDIPRALTPEEQHLWLYTSQLKKEWMIVHWYSMIAFQTTCGTNEMRGQRLGDISLHQAVITIPSRAAKCKGRARTIPLNTAEVMWAYEKLIERARACGAKSPQHYLFPFRRRGHKKEFEGFDPTRPMTESGMKKPWDEVRQATGLTWFRMYDTRHTGITRLAESGMPWPIIEQYSGHNHSERMRKHYTHISDRVRRSWGEHAFRYDGAPFSMPAPPKIPSAGVRVPWMMERGFQRQ